MLADISKGVNHFDTKNINTQDVTEEFLDIKTRLETKKDLEKRYRVLLQKAKDVKEMLEIEREIEKVRADIEVMEGRLNYLKNRSGYSILSVRFYKRVHEKNKFWKEKEP